MNPQNEYWGAGMDPVLQELIEDIDADERLELATKMEAWAELIRKQALGFESSRITPRYHKPKKMRAKKAESKPIKAAGKKPGKGWINVNYSKLETDHLRALAECAGWNFRTLTESALRQIARELMAELRISHEQLRSMTKKQRREFAVRHLEIKRAINDRSTKVAAMN